MKYVVSLHFDGKKEADDFIVWIGTIIKAKYISFEEVKGKKE